MRQIVLIAHNLRSCHNVGSVFRTAEGLGVTRLYLTGYTPYPLEKEDTRLAHLSAKLTRQIQKTALGAELTQDWLHQENIRSVLSLLRQQGFVIAAIEQAEAAIPLPEFHAPQKIALIIGREVEGIEPAILKLCDHVLEIPMYGKKESFNVVQAAAMGLYQCRFRPTV